MRFPVPPYLLDTALLEEEQPTELCREYVYKGGAEMEEASQKLMERVLSEAKRHRAPNAYVTLRQHLIETPVLTEEALMKMSFDPQISPLGANLTELYERVPTSVAERGKVLLCGFCGWTLQRYQGRLRCGDDRCRLLQVISFNLLPRSVMNHLSNSTVYAVRFVATLLLLAFTRLMQ